MTTRRTAVAAALAGLAAVTVTGLAHADAPAQAPAIRIPDRATITVNGHGYGHGHGLSQYGAEGAARKGLSGAEIVRFYYPHTKAGTAKGPVRVHLTADTDDNTTVVARSGLKVRNLDNGSTAAVPTKGAAGKASRWRLSPGAGGATKVSYLHSGWHLWRTLRGDAEFRAGGPLKLVVASSVVTYRGTLQLRTLPGTPAKQRVTVNRVPLDDYVRGVIPREMPALWHQAALRAQAIAARTYAAFEVADSTNHVYQLCDTTSCQVYGGMSAEASSTNEATRATAGQIRTYRGAPAFTQFSASSGGWTSDGGKPYLPAQRDPYDGWPGNGVHTWSTTVTSGAIEKAWRSLGNLTGITVTKRDGHGQWNGRVVSMTLHGSNNDVDLSGDAFRLGLGLRSTWFSLGAVTRTAPARSAGAGSTARAASVDYVALGDSYSAAPLVPTLRTDPAGCLRSTNNYPAFLAGYLDVATYRDVTCSGARVRDFTHRQDPVIPGPKVVPQVGALSRKTDLVTVGIGGNDFGLFGDLTSVCPAVAQAQPKGAPCRRHFTDAHGVNTKYRDARRIRSHVAAGLRAVHRAAPHAHVVVVGYPRLLPTKGTCAAAPFATGDYAFARRVGILLNRSLRLAATAHHATYVSTYGVSRGHDVCAGRRAWVNGPENTATAAAFHPFEKGERGMARRVYRVLTGDVAPRGGDAMPPPGSVILNRP